jgi:hypothetical protein
MDGQSIYSLNTITPSKDETGVYYVQGQTWQVSIFVCRGEECRRFCAAPKPPTRARRRVDVKLQTLPCFVSPRKAAAQAMCLACFFAEADAPQTHNTKVGARYTLVKVLGTGSFSCVCLAVDNETQEQVRGRVCVVLCAAVCASARNNALTSRRRRRRATSPQQQTKNKPKRSR